jgi:dipeptidyl aminopeptidase/acylaminoacyl peptidase
MFRSRLCANLALLARSFGPVALVAIFAACGGAEHPTPLPVTAGALSPAPARKPKKAKVVQAEAAKSDEITLEALLDVHRATSPAAIGRDRFLFLSDAPGTAQIYLGTLGVGLPPAPVKLTSFTDRVNSMRVTPSGDGAVFLKDVGGDENFQLHWLDITADSKPEMTRALTNLPKIRHSLPVFDEEGTRFAFTSNARNGKDMDIYIETRTTKSDEFAKKPFVEFTENNTIADFASDQLIVVTAHSNVNQDIWIVDAKKGTKKLLTKHTGAEGWSAPRFTQDRKAILALTDRGSEFMSLVSLDIATGKVTPILAIDHDIHSMAIRRAGKADPLLKGQEVAIITTNVDGVDTVSIVTIDDKHKFIGQTKTELQGVVTSVHIAPQGDVAFVAVENASRPTEIFRLDIAAAKADRATYSHHAGIDDPRKLVDPELLSFKSFDGKTVSLFYFQKRPSPGEKRPVVVMVHGGPEAQAQPFFNPVTQYLVQSGYAVAAPNVRGSTGYGKTFAHLDDVEKREDSVRDLSEVGKFIAARPDVDPKRIALYGGSYGGYMVLAGLTLYPNQWAAGVDIVGIANFRTFLEQTAAYRRATREAEYGSLKNDGALLDKISPIHKIDRIKVPLMVIHGTRDPRVPIGEAKQVAEGLQKRGLPVQLMTFEDEGHGLAKRANRLVAYPAMVKFLDEHVKRKVSNPAP